MLGAAIGILGLLAVAAWCLAVYSALRIIRLIPAGQRLRAWFTLGWWQFDKLHALAGPGVEPLIKRYLQGVMGFFAAIILSFVLGAVTIAADRNGAAGDTVAAPAAGQ